MAGILKCGRQLAGVNSLSRAPEARPDQHKTSARLPRAVRPSGHIWNPKRRLRRGDDAFTKMVQGVVLCVVVCMVHVLVHVHVLLEVARHSSRGPLGRV